MENKMICQIKKAYENGYAVPAIDVSNMETVYGVMEAAHIANAPVIIQIAPSQLECQKIDYEDIVKLIRIFGEKFPDVDYSIHLDHAETVEDCKKALNAGFSAVMYDGSACSLEDNIKFTKQVKDYAKNNTVEAELGAIGGTEHNKSVSEENAGLTDPALVSRFLKETDADILAVSIGNAHGLYKVKPKIRHDLLKEISSIAKIPLVLHGATGIPQEDVTKAIKNGVAKINYYTRVDNVFMEEMVHSGKQGLTMMECAENARNALINESVEIFKMCGAAWEGETDD